MQEKLLKEMESRMEKTISALKHELTGIHTGKANPALLDTVRVDSYGASVPLNQVASITSPEPRLLVIQPWDRKTIPNIEKAIQKANLGLNPQNDGIVIRLPVPKPSEERRKDMVRLVKKMGEDAKVSIRNIRRDTMEIVKKAEKSGEIPEDDGKKREGMVQKTTDRFIEEIDTIVKRKDAEVMEV
jgi:ribosome recycling factor